MYCECCGTKQEVTWNFCKGCGTKIEKQSDGFCDGRRKESAKAELFSQFAAASLYEGEEEPIDLHDSNDEVGHELAEFGSDWYEELPISDAEMTEYERILTESGYTELIKKLDESNSEWRHSSINIAITGEAGTGKSTLINSLRGLKADDAGAAKTGCTETTTEVTCYPHPEYNYLKVWDLPGVGTPKFTREKYFQTVDFNEYDFLLLVSSSRFKENDMWLAKTIIECRPSAKLFFIRTKLDNDFENLKQERRKPLNAGERTMIVKKIREDILENLRNGGIKEPNVFLINSHKPETFEFNKLNMILIETVSDLKRDAMVLCLASHSEDILSKKVDVLSKRISITSKNAAVSAAYSREHNEKPALTIIMNEARLYAKQLGINTESLNLVAKKFRKDISELKQTIHMHSSAILASEKSFAQYYETFNKYRFSFVDTLPMIGSQRKLRKFQHQCAAVLKSILNMCKSENKNLQTQIALWTYTDSE